jgi:hypothetical protein
MRYFILLVFIVLSLGGCKSKQTLKEKQQELEAGKLDEKNIYNAPEVGWAVKLPENWNVLTKRELNKLTDKGKETVEESTGSNIDISGLIYLVNLKKDAFNSFISTIEPFNEEKDVSYAAHNEVVYDMMKKAYASKNIPVEYEEGTEKINDLQFEVFGCKIYSPDKIKVILNQKMYGRLINGYDFSMTLIYNNEKDLQTLMDMVKSSKFSKRE